MTCNRKKGGRTPAEAGMRLKRPPRRPDSAPAIRITIGLAQRAGELARLPVLERRARRRKLSVEVDVKAYDEL